MQSFKYSLFLRFAIALTGSELQQSPDQQPVQPSEGRWSAIHCPFRKETVVGRVLSGPPVGRDEHWSCSHAHDHSMQNFSGQWRVPSRLPLHQRSSPPCNWYYCGVVNALGQWRATEPATAAWQRSGPADGFNRRSAGWRGYPTVRGPPSGEDSQANANGRSGSRRKFVVSGEIRRFNEGVANGILSGDRALGRGAIGSWFARAVCEPCGNHP